MSAHLGGGVTRLLARASIRAYRIVLWRYPRALRDRYGSDMARLFEQDIQETFARRGWRGLVDVWTRTLADLLRPLPGRLGPPHGRHGTFRARAVSETRAGAGWLDDLGFAWRSLRRGKGFTGVVVLVLGVGVALNATIFAVLNAYLLRPLPYPDADRVVTIMSDVDVMGADARDVLEKRVSWDLDAFTLVGREGPVLALGAWVTPDFLDVYGVRPVIGRSFLPEEGGPGASSVAIIGYGLWHERYGGDPAVLGTTFAAFTSDRPDDAQTFTIVGVLPRDFWHFNTYTEVLAPLREDRALYAGRLRPDVPLERAAQILSERVRERVVGLPADFAVTLRRTQDVHVASVRPTLWALQLAVMLVFLIACANTGVLLLVRSAGRYRELGVRRALGAGPGRIGRQLLAEGSLLGLMAGGLGLALSWLALQALAGVEALSLWRAVPGGAASVRLDPVVVGATLVLAALTGLLFGIVPLASVGRRDLRASLSEGGRSGSDSRGRRSTRHAMVAAEIALSLALLTGAGLMVRSAINLQNADLGFDPAGVLRGQVGLRRASYPQVPDRIAFFETLADRIGALPGVDRVGMINAVPFTWRYGPRGVETDDGVSGEGIVQTADGSYFDAMAIGLRRGRIFTRDDVPGGGRVTVVSATLAAQVWPGLDPVGRRLRVVPFSTSGEAPDPGPFLTVVGVVDDVRKSVDGSRAGDLYLPHSQSETLWMNLVIRRGEGTRALVTDIEAILADMDPEAPFATVQELSEVVAAATAPSRFLATLFASFAAFAMLLAVFGLYGVVSYAARQGRRDVAIRMALGADGASVTRRLLGQTSAVVVAGLAAGLLGGRLLGSALAGQLHGIGPGDPATFAALAVLLGATALAAAWVPAHRAADTPPMIVLRED